MQNIPNPHLHTNDKFYISVALTNGKNVSLDVDYRPELQASGIITVNYQNSWKAPCINEIQNENQSIIATYFCNYLGFSDYYKYKTVNRDRAIILPKKNVHSKRSSHATESLQMDNRTECSALYVKCSGDLTHSKINHFVNNDENQEQLFMTPWNAVIYSDGEYKCTGVLLNASWVLTSVQCFSGALK